MEPDDTVDRTIRNQRYRCWPAWACLGAFALLWMSAAFVLDRLTPREWEPYVGGGTAALMLATMSVVVWHLDRRPVHRIKLGDELRAFPKPGGRHLPANIRAIRFSNDEDGDYIEGDLPVPLCQVMIEPRRGRRIRLVASAGDAARLREWAERHGIQVADPYGLAVPRVVQDSDE